MNYIPNNLFMHKNIILSFKTIIRTHFQLLFFGFYVNKDIKNK